MYRKKRCPNCGKEIKPDWQFCPNCGEELIERGPRGIFEDIDKEFERIDKMPSSEFFRFPRIRFKPIIRGGGISITISSATGREPKVEVKTSGEYKKLEPEIKRKLGVKPAIEEVKDVKRKVKIPKITEEPETKVEHLPTKDIIKIKLPEVKEEDIEVKKLEQSIEIKAFKGDKAYFKLIPIPSDASISKKFKDGLLKIEIER